MSSLSAGLRQWDTIGGVLDQIKRVRASFDTQVVIFMLSFPGQRREVEVWREVLIRTYNRATDFSNVTQYHLDDDEGHVGQAILYFGNAGTDVTISHAQFLNVPLGGNTATFGDSMIYLELAFRSVKRSSTQVVGYSGSPTFSALAATSSVTTPTGTLLN